MRICGDAFRPPGLAGEGTAGNLAIFRQLLPDREEVIVYPRRVALGVVDADVINDNEMRAGGYGAAP